MNGPTKCGDGSDSSIVPGTTETCGLIPNQIVKFVSSSTTQTKIMAERAVPGYVFQDSIVCHWSKASDSTSIYNNGASPVVVPFKFEQVRDCSSHIVKAAKFDESVHSVSSTLRGKTWSSVYGAALPEPAKFNRYFYSQSSLAGTVT